MRAVKRGTRAAPAALNKLDREGKSELVRAREHQAGADSDESFPFKAYKDEEVRQRLEELFHGKCAYCEQYYRSSAPVDIEHFRPKGRIHGESHPGYWWIAMAWENLLPSCIDCNRRRYQTVPHGSPSLGLLQQESSGAAQATVMQTGKQDAFPIAGTRALPEASQFQAEEALLLNPCEDDPREHLTYYIDRDNLIGLVLPKAKKGQAGDALPEPTGDWVAVVRKAEALGLSVRGAVSIQVYGLNRLGLVQERTRYLRRLAFLEDLVLELSALADELDRPATPCPGHPEVVARLRLARDRTLREMIDMADPRAPHSELARQWLRSFHAELEISPAGPGV
jgi:hypothetical protein